MTSEDFEQFRNALTLSCVTFEREPSDALFTAYWQALRDLPVDAVQMALTHANATQAKFPTPAMVRDLAIGDDESRAASAWLDVQKAMPAGSYAHVDFEDGLINATIRTLGGWPQMFERCGNATDENWYRLSFVKTYKAFSSRMIDGEICKPLQGLNEAEVHNGQRVKPIPKRIPCTADRKRLTYQNERTAGDETARNMNAHELAEKWRDKIG